MAKKKTFVLNPSLGMGHLIPMMELAKHLLRHGLAVLVAVVDPPNTDVMSAAAMSRLTAAQPGHLLPPPSCPGQPRRRCVPGEAQPRHAPPRQPSADHLRSLPADALLLDMFRVDALDVVAELGVPVYFFFASAAGDLACFLNLP
ncbi:unnamed protein product [Urochloa humidicola]